MTFPTTRSRSGALQMARVYLSSAEQSLRRASVRLIDAGDEAQSRRAHDLACKVGKLRRVKAEVKRA